MYCVPECVFMIKSLRRREVRAMASETVMKVGVSVKLNAGGGRTVSVPLGRMSSSAAAFDAAKVMNIVGLMEPVLSLDVDTVTKTVTSEITE